MPELPEVETYARDLAGVLPGRTFSGARVSWPRQLPQNEPATLGPRLAGQQVAYVSRRGKYLVMRLSTDWLIVHLKMSGRLTIRAEEAAPDPHAHVVFSMDRGEELRFHDPRKFGRVYLVADPRPLLGRLGPEPLAGLSSDRLVEEGLAPVLHVEEWLARIAGRRGGLKALLLDQTFVAGLGNIYVDETLFAARIHPLQPAHHLDAGAARRLFDAMQRVVKQGVDARGTSLSAGGYRDLTGNYGEMQGSLAVFRRAGQPCPACGRAIDRMVVAGRGTHVCSHCQSIQHLRSANHAGPMAVHNGTT